jgi:hypothetical protein
MPLDFKQQLSGSLPSLQIFVCLLDILQLVNLVNLNVQFTLLNPVEQFLGVGGELFPGYDVVEKSGSHQAKVLSGKSTVIGNGCISRYPGGRGVYVP